MASQEEWIRSSRNAFASQGLNFDGDLVKIGKHHVIGHVRLSRSGEAIPAFIQGETAALARVTAAYKREVPRRALDVLKRSAGDWAVGDRPLAMIRLSHIDLAKCEDDPRERLDLVDRFIAKGETPESILSGLRCALREVRLEKDNPNWLCEPRVPRGSPTGGQWTAAAGAAAGLSILMDLIRERLHLRGAPFVHYKVVPGVPPDARPVFTPQGKVIMDGPGPLMAPPFACIPDVYDSGLASSTGGFWSLGSRLWQEGGDILSFVQGGPWDFQRDPFKQEVYPAYAHVANYAIGVYFDAAGVSLSDALWISHVYASGFSTGGNDARDEWLTRGYQDAAAGLWRRTQKLLS